MKKILLPILLCAFIGFSSVGYSQCTPDASCATLYCPDTLLPAIADKTYSESITFNIPADTTIEISPGVPYIAPIDCVGILNISGMPPAFSYQTNTASGYIRGGESGCLELNGTPTIADTGIYPMQVFVEYVAFTGSLVMADTITFEVEIYDSTDFSFIHELKSLGLGSVYNQPNPFRNETNVIFGYSLVDDLEFTIYDKLGKQVYMQIVSTQIGVNVIPLSNLNLAAGTYIYTLSNGQDKVSRRMVVTK